MRKLLLVIGISLQFICCEKDDNDKLAVMTTVNATITFSNPAVAGSNALFLFEDGNHQVFLNQTESINDSENIYSFTLEYGSDFFDGKETPIFIYVVYDPDRTYINGDEVVSAEKYEIEVAKENNISFTISN
ncbi:MAG: hypothetical protein JW723_07365 [Bacteroidales bacterium]|nr:hypothetical protein [Bacteroidales bacterium]